VWLDQVRRDGMELSITWKSFVLDANKDDVDHKLFWQSPIEEQGRSMYAHKIGKAALRQGQQLFEQFNLHVYVSRHSGKRIRLDKYDELLEVSEQCGLSKKQLLLDLEDPDLILEIKEDHEEAVEHYGVFGTPTFVFENGQSVFVKTLMPPEKDALKAFNVFLALFGDRDYIGEIKRPQPPWPKNVN
jgi:predicted DsbA family dithiol-disulfide isomerase